MNTISGGPPSSSNYGPPQPQQALTDHLGSAPPLNVSPPLSIAPPPSAAQSSNPVDSFMSMMNNLEARSQGQSSVQTGGQGRRAAQAIPVTGKLKQMVGKWATHLGHRAWYEAHGCVDPATTLHEKNGRMANMAMMMGCSNPEAAQYCELSQMAVGGAKLVANMAMMMGCSNPEAAQYCELSQMAVGGAKLAKSRMFMEVLMPQHLRDQFEQCLTPSTLMDSFTGMLGGGTGYSQHSYGLSPPPGAAAYMHRADCSQVSPMLMMGSVGGGEGGMLGPEALENIGRMRNRYLKMTCQENLIMGSLPYRLCCPGKVAPPTMQEAMMIKSMGGA
ncbi:hypothetical protein EGW08_021600 [Elysia chlorotica]|uniref:Uncharacterized protein n=1 Tax=Elysia chlorotica TaxID=188477 RepID=A0A3S0Z6T2_ELYCH|nr:hypothetical protein EGW08_021600 [Elysia chlorotica]